ncbi:formate dehydrogenase subunit gamma [Comamonas koreensis]|uniref:Formate dehydrogenase subunit gamma n=1 Tax=Comamonas koreensis TaxID=160825 RepID=A0AAW4Y1S2_9BURK|nr:formate dehydrogenase subunit gamma [Comamonas koreensis]MCD2167341.1 formate dehydrogenase subunit gamma [Comamonas koreensis]
MKSKTRDIQRYTAGERVNHWVVAISFVLLALSGLAFFHPSFFFMTNLFGGGPWTRILHPYMGLVMTVGFVLMFFRFWQLNIIRKNDVEWLKNVPALVNGEHEKMPPVDKYNGGQKALFWMLVLCMAGLLVTGVLMWRAWWNLPVNVVRAAALLHALSAFGLIGLIIAHIYAAIWTKGTIRAMTRGTVTRAWARFHHPLWYRRMTGDSSDMDKQARPKHGA